MNGTLEMFPHSGKGTLITFCGLDGCGKTTLIKRLTEYLRETGRDVFLTKQPTNAVRQSEIFRTYMDSPCHDAFDYISLSLLAAGDRVQHSSKTVLPALESGKTVVSDRYFYSCLANLRARGYENETWIYEVSGHVVKPDIAFFIDIDVDTAVRRVRSRPEERTRFIDMPLQYRLRKEYKEIAEANGGILLSSAEPEDETFRKVINTVNDYMKRRRK